MSNAEKYHHHYKTRFDKLLSQQKNYKSRYNLKKKRHKNMQKNSTWQNFTTDFTNQKDHER